MQDMLNGESIKANSAVTYKIDAGSPLLGKETTGGSLIWRIEVSIKNP